MAEKENIAAMDGTHNPEPSKAQAIVADREFMIKNHSET